MDRVKTSQKWAILSSVKILFLAWGKSKEERLPARDEGEEEEEEEKEEKYVLDDEEEEKRLRICPQSPATPFPNAEGVEEGVVSLVTPLKAKGFGRVSHESLICGVKKEQRDGALLGLDLWL